MDHQRVSSNEHLDFVSTNHPFLLNISDLRQRRLYTDFSLSCADHDIPCHRLILNARSRFFTTIPEETCYKLHAETSPEILDSVVSFLYTGEISLKSSNYLTIFEIAAELQLNELLEVCHRFFEESITFSKDNWWEIYRITSKYYHREDTKEYIRPLQRSLERILHDEFADISQTNEFLELTFDTLNLLLKADSLKATDEDQVLQATIRWLHHGDRRLNFAAELLYHIRLPFLQPSNGKFEQLKLEKVFQSVDCQLQLRKAMLYSEMPGERWFMSSKSTIPRPSTGMTNSLVVVTVDQSLISTSVILNREQLKSLNTKGPSVVWCIPKPVSRDAMVFEHCSNFYLLDVTTNQLYMTGVEDFGKWHSADTPFHLKRKHCSWVTVGNQTWFIGGVDEDDNYSPAVTWFDWETQKLEQAPRLHCAVQQSCAFHAHGKVYVLGGKDASEKATRHVQVFDIKQQTWSMLANRLPVPVCEKNATAYCGKVYLPVGKTIALFDLLLDEITTVAGAEDIEHDDSKEPCHLEVVDGDMVVFRGGSAITVTTPVDDDVSNLSLDESKDGELVSSVVNESLPVDNVWGMWTGKHFFFSLSLPQLAFNFSQTCQDEAEHSNGCMKVIQFTVSKISKCTYKLKQVICRSDSFVLHDVVWFLSAEKKHSQGKTFLGLFLRNDSSSEKHVSMGAKLDAILLHQSDRKKDIRHCFSDHRIEHGSCGIHHFIPFDELLFPYAGYYDEPSDSIQFSVTVVVFPCLVHK